MKVGFTGTRVGMTGKQEETFAKLISSFGATEFRFGCCTGSDEQAFYRVMEIGGIRTVAHPPRNKFSAFEPLGADTILPDEEFIKRNHSIVDNTEVLIAISKTKEWELRSGTWATIRYAQKLGRPVHIIYPNGDTELLKARKK